MRCMGGFGVGCWCGADGGMWTLRRVAFRRCMLKALVMVKPSCCIVWIWGVGAEWEGP